jgi:hypothetical protein
MKGHTAGLSRGRLHFILPSTEYGSGMLEPWFLACFGKIKHEGFEIYP